MAEMAYDFDDLFHQADNLRNDAQVDKAIAAYQDIATLAEQEGKLAEKARALHMAGVSAKESVADNKGKYYELASNFYSQAVPLYKQANDDEGLGAVYRDMGITADYARDYPVAIYFFQKSIETLERAESYGHLAITYDKLGLHFYKQGRLEEALSHMDKALDLFRRDAHPGFFKATTLYDKARVLFKLKRFDESLDLAQESLSWYEADHDKERYDRRLAQLHSLMSLIYLEQDKKDQSQLHWKKANTLMTNFDPMAVSVLKKDIEELEN